MVGQKRVDFRAEWRIGVDIAAADIGLGGAPGRMVAGDVPGPDQEPPRTAELGKAEPRTAAQGRAGPPGSLAGQDRAGLDRAAGPGRAGPGRAGLDSLGGPWRAAAAPDIVADMAEVGMFAKMMRFEHEIIVVGTWRAPVTTVLTYHCYELWHDSSS